MGEKDKIKQAIKEAGLSQRKLASKMKITQPTLNGIINGESRPTTRTLEKIAKATGKDMSYFFDNGCVGQLSNHNSGDVYQTIHSDMEFLRTTAKMIEAHLEAQSAKIDLLIQLNKAAK